MTRAIYTAGLMLVAVLLAWMASALMPIDPGFALVWCVLGCMGTQMITAVRDE